MVTGYGDYAWPQGSLPDVPATWGDINLQPIYPSPVAAGSLFLDGSSGYLAIPYSPALNPKEITIEAWIKVVDGDCGTIAGNGRDTSYWLAVCNAVQFGTQGPGSVYPGQRRQGEGWHHVALTSESQKGLRTLYVDGTRDIRAGWEPEQENHYPPVPQAAVLGSSDLPLRIGSDRDALPGFDRLHAYISELRIWNRALTKEELRANAFTRLTGKETGLIALYPFSGGLADIAGGHDAGLVGGAALAQIAPDVKAFPVITTPLPGKPPVRVPPPAWDGVIPLAPGKITIDGICGLGEYAQEMPLALEPDHNVYLRMALGNDALYLCTNVLWGGNGQPGHVTLWINRDGAPGTKPSPADLQIQLGADGTRTVGTGDGTGYGGPAPPGIESFTIGDTVFKPQEDVYEVKAPWWAAELRIPVEALAPWTAARRLLLAIEAAGTLAPGAMAAAGAGGARSPSGNEVTGHWPASFNPLQPATWGTTAAVNLTDKLFLPIINRAAVQAARRPAPAGVIVPDSGMLVLSPAQEAVLHERMPAAPDEWPRAAPTTADFDSACPTGLRTLAYAFNMWAKWPAVDPANHLLERAEGILTERDFEVSPEDSPFIHNTHDIDLKVSLLDRHGWLTLGNTEGGGSDQVLETETGSVPEAALPVPGDHMTVAGRWIFDCGHAAKTELHPLPIIENDRQGRLPRGIGANPGLPMQVRLAHVHMTSHPMGAVPMGSRNLTSFDLLDPRLTPFSFRLALPEFGQRLVGSLIFLRVSAGPASAVTVTGVDETGVQVTITAPGSTGSYEWELMLGFLDQRGFESTATAQGYTMNISAIRVLKDGDPGGDGEWTFWVAINDIWRKLWHRYDVSEQNYGANVSATTYEDRLRLRVAGYEDDDPEAGDLLGTGQWDLGRLADLADGVTRTFRAPLAGVMWELQYRVLPAASNPTTALPPSDDAFWTTQLPDEPNADEELQTDLGRLNVPAAGAPAAVHSHPAHMTQPPLAQGQVRMLNADVDSYRYALDDFARVTYDPLPTGLTVAEDRVFPYLYAGALPSDVAAAVGFSSAWISVRGTSASSSSIPYTLQLRVSPREVPPDWGEPLDGSGNRPVDLNSALGTDGYQADRSMPPAWQHVRGDEDVYVVQFPVGEPPPPLNICDLDRPEQLLLNAAGMQLDLLDAPGSARGRLVLNYPSTRFPGRQLRVKVTHPEGRRGIYAFRAHWERGANYSIAQCASMHLLMRAAETVYSVLLDPNAIRFPEGGLPNPPVNEREITLFSQGGYALIQPDSAGRLDLSVSSAADKPLSARLYDGNGVMLTEGIQLSAADIGVAVLEGQAPQSRLSITGLNPKSTYGVQIVPRFDLGGKGSAVLNIGFTAQQAK